MYRIGQTKIFYKLLSYLNDNHINYVIPGMFVYNNSFENDIDIVIDEKLFTSIMSVINDFCLKNNYIIIGIIDHEIRGKCFIVLNRLENQIISAHIDICSNYYSNSRLYFIDKYLLESKESHKDDDLSIDDIFYLSPAKEFIYYLLKKIDKSSINEIQFQHIYKMWSFDPNRANLELAKYFSSKNYNNLVQYIKYKSYDDISKNIEILRKDLHKHTRIKFINLIDDYFRKINRLFNNTGLLVAILGPDGIGKSALINSLSKDLKTSFINIYNYHLYPTIFSKEKNDVKQKYPYRKKIRNPVSSIFKLLYFFILYNIGYIINIKLKLVKTSLIIFDRYYHDIIADPKRYRDATPKWIVKFIGLFIPKPDLWIVLDAPADLIQGRKSEVSIQETEEQRKSYLELSKRLKGCYVVDASKPLSDVVYDVETVIINYLSERVKKRYNL